MVKTHPKVFWGGFTDLLPSQKVFGPLGMVKNYMLSC